MKYAVYGLVVLLLIIHQDFWLWDDKTLLFGFMPIGLFYHACISLAAAATWFLATIFCWPEELIYETPSQVAEKTGGDA
ncbi:DUF3311 domain-containing protein [Rubinisphaera sp.]|uniref:DUF3311 domain-containing protein n=1 Tax=Rubinisphaera sp. TaxID=2024857 RepID=UPI000C0EC88C|nr:DUF3311 domain-containing protein [Rubinisphaera sp.]MBV07973.1 hypothetical protein [Rubinisphaera sp.]HCS50256.1 hypothetical protein [Planctomycetaceae bacterium]|tara:strand:- start:376 stop:612 length:237 start_codon:yes stop_codon:yes gene_type:complete